MVSSIKQLNKLGDKRGLHPNSLSNLKPQSWKPGQSGHPQGESLLACLQRMVEKPVTKPDAKTAPAKELIVYQTIVGAITGKPTQFKETWERLEGKVTQPIAGEGGGPIKTETIIKVVSDAAKKLTESVLSGQGTE